VYESYESFIKSEFKIELTDKDKSQIEKEFFDLIEKQKQTQKIIEDKIEKYKIIEILKDDCLNVTVSQKIQDKIKKNLEGLKKLDNAEGQLNIEKDNLIEYLTKTIDEFFYTELINKIYKKIDPHPDYQAIEFKCEFADAKPRLQIYTTKVNDKGEVERSVPAYISAPHK
jgi:exonuclease SbcC